jgi:hypothetical protein
MRAKTYDLVDEKLPYHIPQNNLQDLNPFINKNKASTRRAVNGSNWFVANGSEAFRDDVTVRTFIILQKINKKNNLEVVYMYMFELHLISDYH